MLEGAKEHSPLEPSEGARPRRHLESRLQTPELRGNTFTLFELPGLWRLAAAAPGA